MLFLEEVMRGKEYRGKWVKVEVIGANRKLD
jgi:hypothetical protein